MEHCYVNKLCWALLRSCFSRTLDLSVAACVYPSCSALLHASLYALLVYADALAGKDARPCACPCLQSVFKLLSLRHQRRRGRRRQTRSHLSHWGCCLEEMSYEAITSATITENALPAGGKTTNNDNVFGSPRRSPTGQTRENRWGGPQTYRSASRSGVFDAHPGV